jgi:regulator of protease activity HflC (stomatin/prohibitin superfamily)
LREESELKNRGLMVAAAVIAALSTSACRTISPDAGHEAVVIKKPWFFGHGGVEEEPIKTGLSLGAVSTEAIYVNMQPIQITEHFDDLMSLDGVPLDFDAVLRIQITDSVGLIKNFGEKWYENNVGAEFRNRVRQAVRGHGMNETAINSTAIDAIDLAVTAALQTYITATKIPINLIQMTVGRANPPDSIKNQRIETAAQQQRILTEQQRKLAEDSRKMAEQSRAEADNAFRNAMQMSPDQYLKLEAIKMQQAVCTKGGCTFIITGGNVTPIVNTK